MNKFAALVPMKANSVRVKDKNIRELEGVPLFYHIMKTLGACRFISRICVDTDSTYIKERLRKDFKEVFIIDRPEHLRGPSVPMNDVIAHDLSLIKEDFFLQTHATNPLLRSDTIDKAIDFFQAQSAYDSLFSVTKNLKRYYDGKGLPVNHDIKILLNTQDMSPLYEENSCLYLFSRKTFEATKNRIGKSPCMYEINKLEAIDIDEEEDFELVKCIFKYKNNQIL